MKAWHFVNETLRDDRPVPVDGEWLEHDGELVLCESGLHASERLIDALQYAPGTTICCVEVGGEIMHGNDKLVAARRRILWRVDGDAVLRAFSRWCALQVAYLWKIPDVVREYLETGNEALRDAAWTAARDAAWDAARAAARDAAWTAAWAAAGDATWTAARAAARDAAWTAARDAARAAQNEQLEAMVEEARAGRTKWIWKNERDYSLKETGQWLP